jgi:hypothetical protein
VSQPALARGDAQERQAFESLLKQALAPLMPLAISYGMNASDLALVTRTVYLEEMEARLEKERGHAISNARLALVAGLTRHEVEQVRSGRLGKESSRSEAADQLTRIAIVLSAWHTNPKFSGAYGMPLDLDLNRSEDSSSGRSFADLIDTACAEMPKTVTLDELVAQGVVELVGGALVRCKDRAAVTSSKAGSGKDEMLAQSGRFLANAAGTVAHNIASDSSETYFDRLLTSDGPLSDRTSKLFHARARTSVDAFLTELDSWLSKDREDPTEGSGHHFGVGVFFFEENRGEGAVGSEEDGSPKSTV